MSSNRSPTRRAAERSEGTSGGRFPASRKRDGGPPVPARRESGSRPKREQGSRGAGEVGNRRTWEPVHWMNPACADAGGAAGAGRPGTSRGDAAALGGRERVVATQRRWAPDISRGLPRTSRGKTRAPQRRLRPAAGPQPTAAVTLRARFAFWRVSRESEVAPHETPGARTRPRPSRSRWSGALPRAAPRERGSPDRRRGHECGAWVSPARAGALAFWNRSPGATTPATST